MKGDIDVLTGIDLALDSIDEIMVNLEESNQNDI